MYESELISMLLFGTSLIRLPKPIFITDFMHLLYVSTLEYQLGKTCSWPVPNSEGPCGRWVLFIEVGSKLINCNNCSIT